MELEEIKSILSKTLNPHRYRHTLSTADMSKRLSEKYGCNPERAYIAGILHDCAKYLSNDELLQYAKCNGIAVDAVEEKAPFLLHAHVGMDMARKKFGIQDEDILLPIRYHTTGRAGMTMQEKILFLADMIEETRPYESIVPIREMAFKDFDKALIMAFDNCIYYVLKGEGLLHPNTVNARNDILLKKAR